MINKISQYYHTIKYLKWIQLYGQVKFRFKKPKVIIKSSPPLRNVKKPWHSFIEKKEQLIGNKLVLLNQEKSIDSKTIWNEGGIEKLWLYHLHYFDVLKNKNSKDYLPFIYRFINENLPGKGIAYEPYPLSLRIVNWIKWLLMHSVHDNKMIHNLATQVRYLSQQLEIHILGNHYLANIKALVFAGLFFDGKEALGWYRKASTLLKKELEKQVLKDGGHFELSPMYHSIILEDVLDLIQLHQIYEKECPAILLLSARKMLNWLHAMCHPDDDIAFFNDAAFDMAASKTALLEYYSSLGLTHKTEITPLTFLKESGFCRIENESAVLIADIGEVGASYQPGHAHADTLSFELSIRGQRVFVNSGTSSYVESKERLRQRSTSAHNTVTVDGKNSSDVWKSFRVGRRAHIKNVILKDNKNSHFLSASHDGYKRIDNIIHTRTWEMFSQTCHIVDEINGKGCHEIIIHFHLHPAIDVCQINKKNLILINKKGDELARLVSSHDVRISNSSYHPKFNQSIVSKKLEIVEKGLLPKKVSTSIKWNG